jgi:UDP-N-acetylmuramoyl-L-alanyl-D-glutamate--2,6-diaminopimelate ligase
MKNLIKKFVPSFLIGWYHFLLAFLGAVVYGFPSRLRQGYGGQAKKLKIIGVTGTNGKTTTVEMISKILEEAGYKVASLSSIKFKIGERKWPNTLKMTMPGRFQIQKFLRQAVNSRCQYVVLEVTSEGILQHRHRFINFDIAVFTNLTPEHIEAHGGLENYRAAKGKLFQATKNIHIINLDDENGKYFLNFSARQILVYTLKEHKTQQYHRLVCGTVLSDDFPLRFSINQKEFQLNLLGRFNIYNALAAICVGLSQNIDLEICRKAIGKVKEIPGRMEEVISQPFKVIVDYAFTPNALEQVYKTIKSSVTEPPKEVRGEKRAKLSLSISHQSKVICVLGACGGGRDKWKRPVLGEIAAKYCDEVIVTNEDPYDEDPMEIIEQVAQGAEKISINQHKSAVYKILDRREAIIKSLELAKAGDIVIITGKGCEPWICVKGGKKIPWDDRQIVREEFKKLGVNDK